MSTPTSSSRHWLIDFLALSAIWGASFMFTQIGTRDLGPLPTTLARVGIGGLFLLPLLLAKGQAQALWQLRRQALVLSLFTSALPFTAYAMALQQISTGTAAIVNATTPLFGAAIAWLWLQERLQTRQVLGLGLGFIGVCALVISKSWGHAAWAKDVAGTLICLLAPLAYGVAASYSRRRMQDVSPLVVATGTQIGASLWLLLPALWAWPTHRVADSTWAAMLALGVVCSGLAYVLFFRIIAIAGAAKALTVTFAVPVFALLYGVTLLGEQLSWPMLASALVIVLGIVLATGLWGQRRPT
jgi:drug/metabolite transporter (DMT)-like permease